jgi:uncharacterized 2Fe-2S/4Fe-4S cluster protein (DUF4445 family)
VVKLELTVEPEGRRIKAEEGTSIMEAFRSSGVGIRSECGSRGICGQCRVLIKKQKSVSIVTEQELKVLTSTEIASGLRLACQTRLRDSLETKRRIQVEGVMISFELNPAVKKVRAQLLSPNLANNQPDSARLLGFLKEHYGLSQLSIRYIALRKISTVLRNSQWDVTATIWNNREIVEIEAGDTTQIIYGISVDVGTSKIAGQLVRLDDGSVVATDSLENPQILHGEDIISRITYASSDGFSFEELRSLVIGGINDLISKLCSPRVIRKDYVYEMTLVGNSAMHHILLGVHPQSLAISPYVPVISESLNLQPKDLGININEGGNIHLLPLVAGFVGSDDIADMLSTGMYKSDKLCLLIDIGTNTEINLGNDKGIVCCSCASGPAFEGGHVHHGMKAVQGAIERVTIDSGNYDVRFEVIGGGKPVGICGSGMIDILAEMIGCNLLDRTGRIIEDSPTKRIRRVNDTVEFVIAWKEETNKDEDIVVTQKDIRELQMAKAAIYAGCHILMEKREVSSEEIDKVYLAGAFGNYIDPKNAKAIGLIPDVKPGKILSVGNTALAGARMALLSVDIRNEAIEMTKNLTYVELGAETNFNREFISATFFPLPTSAIGNRIVKKEEGN